MILLIDNYDSFSYNLYQLLGEINPDIIVIRNDAMSVGEIKDLSPSHIVISPGPGRPKDAGVCEEIIPAFEGRTPILGVCLGHQAICEAYGAKIGYAKKLVHGKQSIAELYGDAPIFKGLDGKISVGRYHSLSVEEDTLPDFLEVVSKSDDDEIMAVRHRQYPIYGLQFHPESIMTPDGDRILANFLSI